MTLMNKNTADDCEFCGNCPVCGQPNNHNYHKNKPWTLFHCHPFYSGDAPVEPADEAGFRKLERNVEPLEQIEDEEEGE